MLWHVARLGGARGVGGGGGTLLDCHSAQVVVPYWLIVASYSPGLRPGQFGALPGHTKHFPTLGRRNRTVHAPHVHPAAIGSGGHGPGGVHASPCEDVSSDQLDTWATLSSPSVQGIHPQQLLVETPPPIPQVTAIDSAPHPV